MRISRIIVPMLSLGIVGLFVNSAHADPISLDSGSTIQVDALDANVPISTTNTDSVNSLPFSKVTSTVAGGSSSSVTSTLSTSEFNFSFSQTIPDALSVEVIPNEGPGSGGETDGSGDMFFTAGVGSTYSIAGSLTATGFFVNNELATSLYDATTETMVYNYDNFDETGFGDTVIPNSLVDEPTDTLTLDSSGGALSGALTAGDHYEFYASQSMNDFDDPNLTGNVSINFASPTGPGAAAPLPMSAPAALIPLMLAGAALFGIRRRALKHA